MTTGSVRRKALVLTGKFLVLAPICLVVWLLVLPVYTELVGYASRVILRYGFGMMITSMSVKAGGFLNTDTALSYQIAGRALTLPSVGHLMANIAPFLALVLATPGLGLKRILKVGAIGIGLIFCSHVATLVVQLSTRDVIEMGRTPLPTAIGFVSITLPFLLWIILAYRAELMAFFTDEPAQKKAA